MIRTLSLRPLRPLPALQLPVEVGGFFFSFPGSEIGVFLFMERGGGGEGNGFFTVGR